MAEEYIDIVKNKKDSMKPDIRDLEILLNKDAFEEMGLIWPFQNNLFIYT